MHHTEGTILPDNAPIHRLAVRLLLHPVPVHRGDGLHGVHELPLAHVLQPPGTQLNTLKNPHKNVHENPHENYHEKALKN